MMWKFDPQIGLSAKEIRAIKFNIKNEISLQLPELPDAVGTRLFLEGRDAWIFNWRVLNDSLPIGINNTIAIEVTVKLKREFHSYEGATYHKFSCMVTVDDNVYHPNISITKIA